MNALRVKQNSYLVTSVRNGVGAPIPVPHRSVVAAK